MLGSTLVMKSVVDARPLPSDDAERPVRKAVRRPVGHLGEDLRRGEFPEVRNVDRIPQASATRPDAT